MVTAAAARRQVQRTEHHPESHEHLHPLEQQPTRRRTATQQPRQLWI
jgi:hypothetical protein